MLYIWDLVLLSEIGGRDRIRWELTGWLAWGTLPAQWWEPQASPQQGGQRNQLPRVVCTPPGEKTKQKQKNPTTANRKPVRGWPAATSELEVIGHEVSVSGSTGSREIGFHL